MKPRPGEVEDAVAFSARVRAAMEVATLAGEDWREALREELLGAASECSPRRLAFRLAILMAPVGSDDDRLAIARAEAEHASALGSLLKADAPTAEEVLEGEAEFFAEVQRIVAEIVTEE